MNGKHIYTSGLFSSALGLLLILAMLLAATGDGTENRSLKKLQHSGQEVKTTGKAHQLPAR